MYRRLGQIVYWSMCGTTTLLVLWGLAGAFGFTDLSLDRMAGSFALALVSWLLGQAAFAVLARLD